MISLPARSATGLDLGGLYLTKKLGVAYSDFFSQVLTKRNRFKKEFSMTDADPRTGEIWREELLQLAFYGIDWPDLSVERLLDRVTEPDRSGDPATARRLGTQ